MLRLKSLARQVRCSTKKARANDSTAATAPVKADSTKSSRMVESTMNRK